MDQDQKIEFVDIPSDICQDLLQYLRENPELFRRVNKAEEPPLRKLAHGLEGECLEVGEGELPLHKHMIKSDKLSGDGKDRYFHGYRFDQKLCEEAVHATEELKKIFGPFDDGADNTFRQVMGYSSGPCSSLTVTRDSPLLTKLVSSLSSLLTTPCQEVYSAAGPQASASIFSLYANIFLPGQLIEMHLDVPEFRGVDRSKCPNWLLAAAHCSGLFVDKRVKNVTCVLYPAQSEGGALGVYVRGGQGIEVGQDAVVPLLGGNGIAVDAESCFHHSERVRMHNEEHQFPPAPELPETCTLSTERQGETVYWVVLGPQGERVLEVPEQDVRFSVSAKFHVFKDQAEREEFQTSKQSLSPEKIIEVLRGDLVEKGVLPSSPHLPLHQLAPLLVKEYILPFAPGSQRVQKLWTEYYSQRG